MKKYFLILVLIIGYTSYLLAYDTKDSVFNDHKLALKIYLNCESCDLEYFKENFTIVNYVREPLLSDVQIMVISQSTGSGGTEYNLIFLGHKRYKTLNDTLVFDMPPNLTPEETRSALLEKMQIGLVPYIMKTAYADRIVLVVDNVSRVSETKSDPWKNWMFDIYGSGMLLEQKYVTSYHIYSNLYIRRITPEIKIESDNDFIFSNTRYTSPVDGKVFHSNQQSYQSRNLVVKSDGDHFGVGGIACFRRDNQYNIDFQMKLGPAIEYNLFSYKKASQKQLRFLYSVNYELTKYLETTIYDKMQDNLYSHNLSIMFKYIQPWGYFNSCMQASSYMNDISHYSIGGNASASIRILKGLSFNVGFGVNMYRNQISLRKGQASWEEMITNQRVMESDYSYNINFGLSFSFGSIFNNSVNPRFNKY